jgi:hypothetical protein
MTPMTRAEVEHYLTRRTGQAVDFVGLDGHTEDGTNIDYNDPIADALESVGIKPDSRLDVSDADVGRVPLENTQWFLRLLELRMLQTVANQFIYYGERFVDNDERVIEVRQGVENRIKGLSTEITARWGLGVSVMSGGYNVGQPGGCCPPATGGLPAICCQPAANPTPCCDKGIADLSRFIP